MRDGKGTTVIAIRTSKHIKNDFKKIAVEFGSYEKAIKAFINAFHEHPEIFGKPRYPLR